MLPEIGNLALAFALGMAVIQFIVPLVGLANNQWRLVLLAKPAAIAQFSFTTLSFVCLALSFYWNDFSVAYVANHSNRELPVIYRLGATWGGHEGSLLLWVFLLAAWTFAVTSLSKSLPAMTRSTVLAVLGGVSVGFLSFILFTSNPFDRLLPIYPLEGSDLNPLLQDPGMVFHPPLLYMGYVGFSVAFAFAIAALIEGRVDSLWARWVRPWTQAAWMFLTLGIAAGSWWAYYELGWGGWWFWDPVENASFMPWLIGTALLHSLAATEKRGVFKAWTTLLAISAFSFSLLGTFLVRSGVLTSVHAFANDPVRGTYILIFLLVIVGSSLALFAARGSKVSVTGWFNFLSREFLFLINNLILAVVTITVLLGTLYPIITELMSIEDMSVGEPYFDTVFTILMTPLIFLIGIGPIINWRSHKMSDLIKRTRWAFAASIILAFLQAFMAQDRSLVDQFQIFIGIFLVFWVIILNFSDWWKRSYRGKSLTGLFRRVSLSSMAMYTAHIGLAIVTIGVVLSSNLSIEKNVRFGVGDSHDVAGYEFRFDKMSEVSGPNYDALRGYFTVSQNGNDIAVLHPEKRQYRASGQQMTEAGIDSTLTRDLYVALGDQLPHSDDWAVRVYVKPYIYCLWLGSILMALGGLLAMMDRRYRKKSRNIEESTDE